MSTDAQQIRDEIESTRGNLSRDVDALADKVNPRRMVHRRADRIRGAASGVRDRIMGTASSTTSVLSDTSSSIGESASQASEKVKDAATGNPVAAGVVVFGAAWLISSLLSRTQREEQAVARATTLVKEHAEPVAEAIGDAGREIRDGMREPVREATESVRSAAGDASEAVKAEAKSGAHDVRDNVRSE